MDRRRSDLGILIGYLEPSNSRDIAKGSKLSKANLDGRFLRCRVLAAGIKDS